MIVAQTELDQILDRKIRKRLLELPVRHGKFGERKRCPVRLGQQVDLYPPIPFERMLARAEQRQPRKHAVVWLIGRVERWEPKPVTITVSQTPVIQGEVWLVRFIRGSEREAFDTSAVYLSADGGFTTVASRQAVPGDPEYLAPFAEDLARARLDAREKRLTPQLADVRRLTGDLQKCRDVMTNVKAGTLLKRAQRNLEAAQRALLSEGVLDSDSVAASVGSAAGEADRPPSASTLGNPDTAQTISPAQLGE
jgi:hypothetical protein